MSIKRILLGHLGRRGDCLYATAIARQIKNDFPGSHLTWAVGSVSRKVVEGNPYVDDIWEVPDENGDIAAAWQKFEADARHRKNKGEFDEIYFTQVHPGNFQNYDGTSRSSIFRGYPGPITVPIQPVVRLSESEVVNVRRFAERHALSARNQVVLFECASTSGQSFVDQKFALAVAQQILKNNKDVCFILSSDKSFRTADTRIIDGSVLSFKENAEVTKYCSLLIGCSSGISWLATSDWAKPLPKILLLNASTVMYASMIHDAVYFGLPTDEIIEMQNCSTGVVSSCVQLILDSGFPSARLKYHRDIPVNFSFYFKQLYWELLRTYQLRKAAGSLSAARERFGNHPQLERFIHDLLLSYISLIRPRISERELAPILDLLPGKPCIPGGMMSTGRIVSGLFDKNTFIVSLQLMRSIAKNRLGFAMPGSPLGRA